MEEGLVETLEMGGGKHTFTNIGTLRNLSPLISKSASSTNGIRGTCACD
jgi:hypothetical protein